MTDPIPVPDDALADLSDAEQVALIERTDNSFDPNAQPDGTQPEAG